MPFNGSGVYNPPSAPTFPAIPNTTIESTKFNDIIQDLATNGLTKCITRDGQSPAQANLPMAGFRHTGVGNAVSDTDYAAFGQAVVLRGGIGASDWDNLIKTGLYEATAASLAGPAANFPPTSTVGQLLVAAQGAVIDQFYITSLGTFTRQKTGASWSAWIANVINANTTLNVPSVYATPEAAMAFLRQQRISAGVTVTIQVADGTYDLTTTVLNHPDAAQIQLIGNTATPANCVLRWNTAANVVLLNISDGTNFGLINGFTVTSNGAGTLTAACGCQVSEGSSVTFGTSVIFTGWAPGLRVMGGSKAFGACTINSSGTIGMEVKEGSVVVFAPFSGNAASSGFGTGNILQVDTGSFMSVVGGTVQSGTLSNIVLQNGSTFFAQNFQSNTSGDAGYSVINNAQLIFSTGCSINNNTTQGIRYSGAPRFVGNTPGFVGNAGGNENNIAYITSNQLTTTDGDIRVTPASGDFIRLDATFTAAGDAASTGYVEMKDSAGTLRRFMIRA